MAAIIPDGPAQLEIIRELDSSPQAGESWYLISRKWYNKWSTSASGIQSAKDDIVLPFDQVGPIDNSDISENGSLLPGLSEGVQLHLLNQQSYDFLVKWYGTPALEFKRQAIEEAPGSQARIEFYPPMFYVQALPSAETDNNAEMLKFSVSAAQTGRDLVGLIKSHFPDTPFRIWRLTKEQTMPITGNAFISLEDFLVQQPELVLQDDKEADLVKTLSELLLDSQNNRLVIDPKAASGAWTAPSPPPSRTQSVEPEVKPVFGQQFFGQNTGNSFLKKLTPAIITRSQSATERRQTAGLVGLQNLGNTCFMNSALQCMSNTKELQEYFLANVYLNELNPDNPLSKDGHVARAFGKLMKSLWTGNSSSVPPREFKHAVARFAPQFSGYGQQDSQELLAFLLDGIHEDLNRILKKPATSAPDWEGGGDKELLELAKVCWDQYVSRNDSVIVDLFQGQYKSTLVCPQCDKVSITFDPFMYITVNLPVQKYWTGKVFYVPMDPAKPRYVVHVQANKNSNIKTLKGIVASLVGTEGSRLVVYEEWKSKFFKNYTDDEIISEINTDNDRLIFAEVSVPTPQPKPRRNVQQAPSNSDTIILPVIHTSKPASNSSKRLYHSDSPEAFGSPFILSLTREQASSQAEIFKALIRQYARVTSHPDEILEYLEDAGTLFPVLDSSKTMNGDSLAMDVDIPITEYSSPENGESNGKTTRETSPEENSFLQFLIREKRPYDAKLPLAQQDCNTHNLKSLSARHVTSITPPSEEETAESIPLVETGDILFVDWSAQSHKYFFEKATWEEVTPIVDPVVEESKKNKSLKKKITLEDCLTEFTKEERLGEDDTWYCPQCKEHQQATKKVELWKAPDVLVFALKRFSSNRWSRDKIDDFVDFPLENFDMSPYVESDKAERRLAEANGEVIEQDSLIYDLYAVDNHYGGLGGGHYTAYAKNPQNNRWYDFDDSRVSPISDPERVVTRAAYLLFYRRRTAHPLGAKTRQLVDSAIAQGDKTGEAGLDPELENGQSLYVSDAQNRHPHRISLPDHDDDDEDEVKSTAFTNNFFPSSRTRKDSLGSTGSRSPGLVPDLDEDSTVEDDSGGLDSVDRPVYGRNVRMVTSDNGSDSADFGDSPFNSGRVSPMDMDHDMH